MLKIRLRRAPIAALGALVLATPAVAGPDWVEIGNAGTTLQFAQRPLGPIGSPLNNIQGNLLGGLDGFADMFFIAVPDPAAFSMEIAQTNFNAQLFIFHITQNWTALGLLANDDRAIGDNRPLLTPIATDGTNARLEVAGDYIIAVSGSGHNPISSAGRIYNIATSTEISGPDGPGGFNHHIGWEGPGVLGSYSVQFTGTVFPSVPNPGTLVPLALGLGLMARRRR
jgi:hypothetical protein